MIEKFVGIVHAPQPVESTTYSKRNQSNINDVIGRGERGGEGDKYMTP